MYQLFATPCFSRRLRIFLRKHPQLRQLVQHQLDTLTRNPFAPSLKLHRLTGKMKRFFAASVTYEHRLIMSIKGNTITLHNIGSHDEVY